jgi:protein SCO1/2
MTAETHEAPAATMPWRGRLLLGVVCLVLGGLGGLWAATADSKGKVPPRFYPPAEPTANFTLRDQNGDRISLQGQRGHVVALTFLYSTCWDLCPAEAEVVRDAIRRARARDTEVLVVSVDPVGDTPGNARTFIAKHLDFGGPVHFLLGTRRELEPVWKMYGVAPIDATPAEAKASAAAAVKYWAMQAKSGAPPEDARANFKYPKRPAPVAAGDPYPSATDLQYRGRTRHAHGAEYEHSAYVMLIDKHGRQRVGFPFEQLDAREVARDLRALVAEP